MPQCPAPGTTIYTEILACQLLGMMSNPDTAKTVALTLDNMNTVLGWLRKNSDTFNDLIVVAKRFKQDSDVMRAYELGGAPVTSFTQDQLNNVNASPARALQKIPAELDLMQHALFDVVGSMNVMAVSMGSTMGRVGSWMP